MRITEISSNSALGPWCTAKVHAHPLPYTTTQFDRHARMKKKGLPFDACGTAVKYRVDGEAMCQRHAADLALAYVLGGGETQPPRKRDVLDVR